MWQTWVRSLGWEDPLEEGMATHSSILAYRIPMNRGVCYATMHGVTKGLDMTEQQSTHSTRQYRPLAGLCSDRTFLTGLVKIRNK